MLPQIKGLRGTPVLEYDEEVVTESCESWGGGYTTLTGSGRKYTVTVRFG